MKSICTAFCTAAFIAATALTLSGCFGMGGESYTMGYGIGVQTDDGLAPEAYTFEITISGK